VHSGSSWLLLAIRRDAAQVFLDAFEAVIDAPDQAHDVAIETGLLYEQPFHHGHACVLARDQLLDLRVVVFVRLWLRHET